MDSGRTLQKKTTYLIRFMHFLRSLLILGRVSNLPTVWANCLTGWVLAGQTHFPVSFWLMQLSATFFYIGGMYWNDAFDSDWDQKHAPERPIPRGDCSRKLVWVLGSVWFGIGFSIAIFINIKAFLISLPLFLTIFLYDWIHKKISWSSVIMAGCRFWLILFACGAGSPSDPIPGFAIWSALFLFTYIVGLSYIARHERLDSPFDLWPVVFLFAPVLWAFIFHDPVNRLTILAFVIPFVLWTLFALRYVLFPAIRKPGKAVSLLLAGMVLVDLMFIQPWGGPFLYCYIALFILCPITQRWIPAT